MKKSLIATAVAAGVLATGAAQAQPTVYGILHLSINSLNDAVFEGGQQVVADGFDMTSNTSAIGVKGSEDLGAGLKAIYKAEFRIDPFSSDGAVDEDGNDIDTIERRDIWVGLKGGWGKVAAGTMSSNYKQMGGKIDPLYRTVAEGRGILNMQSRYHSGADNNGRGRMTQALQYTTPKMAGIEVVLNTTVANKDGQQTATLSNDETIGIGVRWSNKNFLVFADYLDPNEGSRCAPLVTGCTAGRDESVAKLGGKWENDQFQVSGQYEMTDDQLGGDYLFLNGWWKINKSNDFTVSYGQQDNVSNAFAVGYVYKFSKQTNVYAAYGFVEADKCDTATGTCTYDLGEKDAAGNPAEDNGVISFGIRKSF